jgi:hypothetical protein
LPHPYHGLLGDEVTQLAGELHDLPAVMRVVGHVVGQVLRLLVSLLPFATAWIARTRLASSPVVFYAGLFVCVDIAYNVFEPCGQRSAASQIDDDVANRLRAEH